MDQTMLYDQLNDLTLLELRQLAKDKLLMPSATTYKKGQLIEKIIEAFPNLNLADYRTNSNETINTEILDVEPRVESVRAEAESDAEAPAPAEGEASGGWRSQNNGYAQRPMYRNNVQQNPNRYQQRTDYNQRPAYRNNMQQNTNRYQQRTDYSQRSEYTPRNDYNQRQNSYNGDNRQNYRTDYAARQPMGDNRTAYRPDNSARTEGYSRPEGVNRSAENGYVRPQQTEYARPAVQRTENGYQAPQQNAYRAPQPAAAENQQPAAQNAVQPTEMPHQRPTYGEYNTANPGAAELLQNGECREGGGVLEITPDGYGFLRAENYTQGPNDIYVAINQIRRFNLRTGDYVRGKTRAQREGDRYEALLYITEINGCTPEEHGKYTPFENLTPVYPNERIRLEDSTEAGRDLALRTIDLFAPIGKGQRGLIVSQPKAGKTVLLKKIANSITRNYPDTHLIVLLIDERPEEVTDMRRSIQGEVVSSTFDEEPENHARVAELVFGRAQRLVEHGKDVVILMDSITRLARAYNLVNPPTGRSLSGGLDPGALYKPKRFFGAARNLEKGGSLTVIATALVETGSRMDDIIYEEFKGTGNMEIHLNRKLSERRIFPAIDIEKSGTRRDELLLTPEEQSAVLSMRRMLIGDAEEITEQLIDQMTKTLDNATFMKRIEVWTSQMNKK